MNSKTRMVALAMIAAPGLAEAKGMTPALVFAHAAPPMKVLVLGLLVSTVLALVVTARKLTTPSLAGGSAFLSGLRLGGPMVGFLGAAFTGLTVSIGLSNVGQQPVEVLAPAFAEAAFVVVLGMLAGLVAVVCHALVEARIDRKVLAL